VALHHGVSSIRGVEKVHLRQRGHNSSSGWHTPHADTARVQSLPAWRSSKVPQPCDAAPRAPAAATAAQGARAPRPCMLQPLLRTALLPLLLLHLTARCRRLVRRRQRQPPPEAWGLGAEVAAAHPALSARCRPRARSGRRPCLPLLLRAPPAAACGAELWVQDARSSNAACV
jgi:hypothetical protein